MLNTTKTLLNMRSIYRLCATLFYVFSKSRQQTYKAKVK